MDDTKKSGLFLAVFATTAFILGWGVWTNYRPQVIHASCSEIANKTSNLQKRTSLSESSDEKYDQLLHNCLRDAGYE